MLFCKHDTPRSSMLGAHSWFPEGRPGHRGHLCSGRRAAAWQLPQCVYPSPDKGKTSCKGLLEAGDSVKTGGSWM